MDLERIRARLSESATLRPVGRVVGVTGLLLRVALPGARVSDVLVVRRRGEPLLGEVVGFEAGEALVVPLGEPTGVGPDDIVEATGESLQVAAGTELLGRVLDGLGRPLDGRPFPAGLASVPVDRAPPPALERPLISEAFATGVRAIDAFTTLGVGQRVGLFAGSGVGKSTLLGSIARGANADAVVVALVGERGREVSEFLEHALGPEGRRRAVVVVATSDAPPIERLRAAQVATALAERLRDLGKKVLLLVDSVTRFARAQREIGLAAGEPPARRGYPPSVFTQLPRLLERSGQAARGSITAIYTVLVEGSDMEEPIADEVRGILDGHIVLDRRLGARGHYPAIDVLSSLSRVMTRVAGQQHIAAAQRVRSLLAAYEEKRDLIALGAYAKGSDAKLDQAIAALPEIERLLRQNADSVASLADSVSLLTSIAERYPERR